MGYLYMGWSVTGWGVDKRDRVLIHRMSCYYKGWGVIKRDGVIVNGMGC